MILKMIETCCVFTDLAKPSQATPSYGPKSFGVIGLSCCTARTAFSGLGQ